MNNNGECVNGDRGVDGALLVELPKREGAIEESVFFLLRATTPVVE
jgi:hypothetical protein